MGDLQKTIHYTTESEIICGNLVKYIPADAQLIEPFVGGEDLVQLFPNHNWETYDIDPSTNAQHYQDTLTFPPNYKGKWVITNPPFLAKNKASEKTIFDTYGVDDLYKAFLLSILDCEGGIVIVPTNFLSDERTADVRKKFFNHFEILELNVFTVPVFKTTTYSVCSFAFKQAKLANSREITCNVMPADNTYNITLYETHNYRLGGDIVNKIESYKNYFGRLTVTTPSSKFITNIKLYGLDTRNERIHVSYEDPYVGKSTDRVYATFVCDMAIPEETQKKMVERFNKEFEQFRMDTFDLALTNYRDYNRKRVGFDFAYRFLSMIYDEVKES
jgi:hypothetical protein